MVDRTRDGNHNHASGAAVYESPVQHAPVMQPHVTTSAPNVDVDATVIAPVDRVRWGAIIAGLLAALSALAVLSLLGLAIGAAQYDNNDTGRSLGIGTGVWGGLSALLAFLLGGWVAAKTAAVRGERNGMINGAMVWALAIPLLLFALGSGASALLRTAGDVAVAGSQVAGERANDADVQANIQNQVQDAQQSVTPERAENAADDVAKAALGTLGSLLLGLGAASLGGYLGARTPMFNSRREHMV